MAENTSSAKCSDAEFDAARDSGLLFADLGSTAQELALHKFAEAIRREGWIHITDKLPQVGQQVLLWALAENHRENDEGYPYITDESGVHMGECRDDGHGPYLTNYSTPFADVEVITYWMPLPGEPGVTL